MPALIRPKIAVTVSIIANFLCAPREQNDCRAAQSKGFRRKKLKSNPTDDFLQQVGPVWGSGSRKVGGRATATVDSPPRKFSPFPPCSRRGMLIRWCGSGRIGDVSRPNTSK